MQLTLAPRLEAGETIKVTVGDSELELTRELLEITISAREGFTVAMENGRFVILYTTLTAALINEGLAKSLSPKCNSCVKRE